MPRILASKLVVGIGGLAISMAAIWAVVYAMPVTGPGWLPSNQYIIEDVDYWRMVLIWMVPMALAYGMVFLASTVTDNPAKALAGGIGIFVAVMFGTMMVDRVLPELQVKFLVELLLRDVDFDDDGNILRSARDAGLVGRLLFAGVLTGTGFATAVAITARLRENSVGWRPLLGCGVVLLAVFLGIGNLPVDRHTAVEPALELRFEQPAKDMVIDGARAYVLGEDDLIIVDISSTDSLRAMGRLPLDGLHRSRMVQCGQYICVGGYRNVSARNVEDEALSPFNHEVLVVDAGLTERPKVVDRHELDVPEHGMIPFDMHFAKGALFVRTAGSKEHQVTAMAIDENGVVGDLSAVSLAEQDRDFWSLERSRSRQIASNALGTVLFLDLPSGLAIVDIANPSIMEEIGRVQLETKIEERVYGGSRDILAIGDSILVFRLGPNEYAVLGVTDPVNPRELEPLGQRSVYRNAQIAGDRLYRRWGPYVEIFDRLNSDELIHSYRPFHFDLSRLVLRDGTLYVLGRGGKGKPGAPNDHRYRLQVFRVDITG